MNQTTQRIITQEGLKKLQEELEDRRTRVRQTIAQAIKEAKEQGDLSENAEYSEARREQNENEARVAELEMLIKTSVVAAEEKTGGTARIGSTVTVKAGSREMKFVIVGSNEADPAAGKISNESPLGRAFLGRQAGDKVTVETPSGGVRYVILSVE